MKRLLLPALLLTTLTACTAAPADTLPAAVPTPTPASTPAPTAAPTPADALTPEEKIGQLFIIRPDYFFHKRLTSACRICLAFHLFHDLTYKEAHDFIFTSQKF